MLNTNLSHQYLSAFTNIYDVPIEIFDHLWKLLHNIVSFCKGCVPYEDQCAAYCLKSHKNMYLFLKSHIPSEAISIYYATPLWSHIGPISKHVLRFVCLREMHQSNRFFWPTPRCTFDLCTALLCNNYHFL